ncbi:hypothetical protein BSKO_13089 [Bryopsis sp. KO-2023]|nr:hypothetical protein BSKO_13089 [Bryopsis sp. KO-2023]
MAQGIWVFLLFFFLSFTTSFQRRCMKKKWMAPSSLLGKPKRKTNGKKARAERFSELRKDRLNLDIFGRNRVQRREERQPRWVMMDCYGKIPPKKEASTTPLAANKCKRAPGLPPTRAQSASRMIEMGSCIPAMFSTMGVRVDFKRQFYILLVGIPCRFWWTQKEVARLSRLRPSGIQHMDAFSEIIDACSNVVLRFTHSSTQHRPPSPHRS